jgi:hypothetical protein
MPVGNENIAEDVKAGVCAPDEAAGDECCYQKYTVDELNGRTGQVELIAEPVNVEER